MSLSFHGICLIYIWSWAIWKTEGRRGANGREEVIWCNSLNTVGWNIASLPPRHNDNGSPGLTPGPDGDSLCHQDPDFGNIASHWLDCRIAKFQVQRSGVFDQIVRMSSHDYCVKQQPPVTDLRSSPNKDLFPFSVQSLCLCMFWSNLAVSKLVV